MTRSKSYAMKKLLKEEKVRDNELLKTKIDEKTGIEYHYILYKAILFQHLLEIPDTEYFISEVTSHLHQ